MGENKISLLISFMFHAFDCLFESNMWHDLSSCAISRLAHAVGFALTVIEGGCCLWVFFRRSH
jgi:hypothetical protein